MTATPLKTRERILARYDTGKYTRVQVARYFTVSEDLVKKLLKQRKKLGHVEPLYATSGRKAAVRPEHGETIRGALREDPGLTLSGLRDLLGLPCSVMSVWRALKRMGFTCKKTLRASEQNRADIGRRAP